MAGKVQIEYPDKATLEALLDEAGSVVAAAARLGISSPGLRHHLRKIGVETPRPGWKRQVAVDPSAPVSEVDLLRQELREAQSALTQYRKRDVQAERIVQAVDRALERTPAVAHVPVGDPAPAAGDAHHRHLLLLSDFHGGERVDSGAVHGLNTYDWQVMEQRIDETIAACLSHKRRAPELTGLDVGFLGDMNSGFIHKELAETNEFNPADGAIRIGHLLADIIRRLAPHYPEVRVFGVPGNHGRLDLKMPAKQAHNNLDWISYKLAEALLAPVESVSCQFPEADSLLWEIAGRTIYVWHGDGVRSSMPGVPWGGIMRRCNEIAKQHIEAGIRIDHFALGHFHQANVVQGGRIFGNGALKGLDEYCKKAFGGGDPPSQLLTEFDEKSRRLTNVRYLTPTTGVYGAMSTLAEAA